MKSLAKKATLQHEINYSECHVTFCRSFNVKSLLKSAKFGRKILADFDHRFNVEYTPVSTIKDFN